jgi:hypothetical protein
VNLYELKNKTLADDNFLKQMSYKLNDSDERASFFNWVSKLGNHWQENPTPYSIIRKMVSKTSLQNKKILVLFNIEFLHVLVDEQKVNSSDIVFISDNKIERLCAIKIFKVQSYNLDDFSVPALKKMITGIDMKFDLVFSNPPYTNNVDIKILSELVGISEEIIAIHPSTWLIDCKYGTKFTVDFRNQIKDSLKSVEMFNGNPVFNIGLYVPTVITHINSKHSGNIDISFFNENYNVSDIFDISKYGEKWITLVKPFFESIKTYQSINDVKIDAENPPADKFFVQMARIRGHVNLSAKSDSSKIAQDDFYTMVMKSSNDNKGIRKTNQNPPTFAFDSEQEQNNFIEYLKTDFARFCLSIYKNGVSLVGGELGLIPWLDFTEQWDDEKLFKKFDVSQELQDYIRDFLPDYYGIRK